MANEELEIRLRNWERVFGGMKWGINDSDEPLDHGPEKDMVDHPSHYISENGLETIDVIRAFTSNLKGMEAVCTANVLKYICRWKNKNGIEDLKKARWYLNCLIDKIETEN